ncbi:hypothetical protein B0T09DRAFT_269711 [Sordaria sp. MPI-SDFR-AT-0083]|nr:hypothetical protein B0T09DRAFT_269711 [Sordaria sp. MPI-SDFR-AT-0083]
MAILSCLPGLEVTVEVDSQRAHEYDAGLEEVESRAEESNFHPIQQTLQHRHFGVPYVLKCIEAKPGKRFIFVVDMTNCHHVFDWNIGPSEQLSYSCHLDGFCAGLLRACNGVQNVTEYWATGSRVAGWKRRYFRFEGLDVLEGGDGSNAENAKKYGTLPVRLFLKVGTGRIAAAKDDIEGPPLIHSVHEKDLKGRAVDSKVSFNSEPIEHQPDLNPIHTTKCVDPRGRPIAVFEFRYRTMGLHQECVIPCPRPVHVVVNADEDEDKEVIDVEEEDKKRIKREPEDDASRGLKREAPKNDAQYPVSSYKLRRLDNGDAEIDLTDD